MHVPLFGERLRGNTIRGNRTESLWEGNLPLRGCLWEGGFQRFSKLFRGFQRFSEVLSETLSEADFPLRGSRSCCPYSCCPLIFLQLLHGQVPAHMLGNDTHVRAIKIISNNFWDIANIGTSLAFYRGQKGLSLENSKEKSEKGFPGVKKTRKRVDNEPKPENNLKNHHFRLIFELFRPRGREAPRTVFLTFFGVF